MEPLMTNSVETRADPRPFVRAETWLLGLAGARAGGNGRKSTDFGHLLQVLFGVWLCERAVRGARRSSEFTALVASVAERLDRTVAAGEFDPSAHDATLLLLSHHILVEHGRPARGLTDFAQDLNAMSVSPHATSTTTLLAQLGYRSCPARTTLTVADVEGDAGRLLQADACRIRAVCDLVGGATRFGLIPLAADRAVRESLTLALPIVLALSLRHNDLETGTAVLRTLRYLRLTRTRVARQAISHIADQQQGDGRFGYLAAEVAAATRAQGWLPFDAGRRLYLPITVSCLWALADATVPRFTLVPRSAGPPDPRPRQPEPRRERKEPRR
jgi:hypothetical protein